MLGLMSRMIKTTLAEQAYDELRTRILNGMLEGGRRLLPNDLADDLGISPTPVKEALGRLEADGLIVNSTRRGMSVRRLTMEDVEEIYNARVLLERGAIERAFALHMVDDDLIAELKKSVDQHRLYASGGTLDDLSRALDHDRRFHRRLVATAGIGMVSAWHDKIMRQTHTVFVSVPGNYSRSVREHEDVLDALSARSLTQTLAAMERHLTRSLSNTLLQVQKLEEISGPTPQ